MNTDAPVNKDKLMQDLKVVMNDAEELLRATANQAGDKVAAARERIQDSMHRAQAKLADAEAVMLDKTKQAARAADEYVHENPWKAVGIGAGVGLIIGLLIGRR